MLSSHRARHGAIVVASLLWLAGSWVPAQAAGSVQVNLRASGPTSASQGPPFTFRATARNPTPDPLTVSVGFELFDVTGGHAVDFGTWRAAVPAEGSVTTDSSVISSQWFAGRGTFEVHALVEGQESASPLVY